MACTTFKSLTLAFTAPDPAPADGYRVKWRAVGDTEYTYVFPNPRTTPIVIPQVPVCTNIEGTIETSCGGESYGAPVAFVTGATSPVNCASFTVINNKPQANTGEDLVFRYMPCGGGSFVTIHSPIGTGNYYWGGICADKTYGIQVITGEATINQESDCQPGSNNPQKFNYNGTVVS